MDQIYIPLISGLVGAVIGAVASIVTVWVQAKTQDRREKIRHAAELALEDYKLQLDLARKSGKQVSIPPVVLFLHYHLGLMDLMENGKLNSDTIKELAEQNIKFSDVIKELNQERKNT